MKAIILHYPTTSVYVAELPSHLIDESLGYVTTENIEDYLSANYGFYLDEINYMVTDDECPVYPCGKDETDSDFGRIATL